jgi:hypothetical protein
MVGAINCYPQGDGRSAFPLSFPPSLHVKLSELSWLLFSKMLGMGLPFPMFVKKNMLPDKIICDQWEYKIDNFKLENLASQSTAC